MDKKRNKTFLILLILLIIILIAFITSMSFGFTITNRLLKEETKQTTDIKDMTTTKTLTEINTSTSKNIKHTEYIERVSTTRTKKITTTNIVKDNLINKMYYYKWTEDESRDFTGRNCLFLYDIEGNIVEGYATLLYYNKYIKEQFITKDINNCFLEDKYSTEILNIKINGEIFE